MKEHGQGYHEAFVTASEEFKKEEVESSPP
jgi:hypothetical protein